MATVAESITQIEAAKRLRITTAWVRDLTHRGILSRNEDRSYPWPTVVEEYEAFKLADRGEEPKTDYQAELARLTREKADAAEMENARRRGQLVPVEEMRSLLREALKLGNRALGNAPRKLGRRWARRLKVKEARAIELIEEIVEDVRAEMRSLAEELEATDAAAD